MLRQFSIIVSEGEGLTPTNLNLKMRNEMRIRVDTIYEVWTLTRDIELPEGKTVDDIKNIYVKGGEGSIEFKDGTTLKEYFTENHDSDHHYFDRPEKLTFAESDVDEYDDYGGKD